MMKPVIGMFMRYIKQYGHANSQSDSESTDVDYAVELITEQIPNSNTQIADNHLDKLSL